MMALEFMTIIEMPILMRFANRNMNAVSQREAARIAAPSVEMSNQGVSPDVLGYEEDRDDSSTIVTPELEDGVSNPTENLQAPQNSRFSLEWST